MKAKERGVLQGCSYISIWILVLMSTVAIGQERYTIRGSVSSVSGMHIAGASVKIVDEQWDTSTNKEGAFSIKASERKGTLVISHIGYREERVPYEEGRVVRVTLQAIYKEIEETEVVHTGYQTIPKERATGAFSKLNKDVLTSIVSTNVMDRLEGNVNSLSFELPRVAPNREPSSTAELRMRGLSTINGENNLLVIVDNFPYEGDISNINPNDIENITFLKDAAASSIWGARAGNGVIVITTKRGKENTTPKIAFNSSINIFAKPNLFYSPRYLPPKDQVDLERTLFDSGIYTENNWVSLTPAVELFFVAKNGSIDALALENQLKELATYDIRNQASNYLYQQNINKQNALSVHGGSSVMKYFLSAGLDDNKEQLKGNSMKRVTVNLQNEVNLSSRMKLLIGVNYMDRQSRENGIPLSELAPSGMSTIYSYARLADDKGYSVPLVRINRYAYTEKALSSGLLDWHYRPLDEIKNNDNVQNSAEVRINTTLSYEILKSLRVSTHYQFQDIRGQNKKHYTLDSYYTRNMINRYTQANGSSPIPKGGILDRSTSGFRSNYGRIQLDHNMSINDDHIFVGLAGFEIREEILKDAGNSRLYGYNDDLLTSVTLIDYVTNFPLLPRASSRVSSPNTAGKQLTDRFISYFSNYAYSFKSKYTLSGSIRYDASNIFGVAFNLKGVPLWSLGSAWNVSEEQFFDIPWINHLKGRLTYGSNGNVMRSLSVFPIIGFGRTNGTSNIPSAVLESVGNPDLSWEKVSTLNLGLDFSLFNRRIFGNVDVYTKKSANLIGNDFIDPTSGIIGIGSSYNLDNRRNYANMKTSGVDIELHSLPVRGKFQWQTTVFVSFLKNKITKYYAQSNPDIASFFNLYTSLVIEGYPKDQLYAIPWHGLDALGNPQVLVNTNYGTDYNDYFSNLSVDDLLKVGSSTPTVFGSFRNSFSWKNLSFSANIIFKAGYSFRRDGLVYNYLFNTGSITHSDYLNRWQSPGDERYTNVPSVPEKNNIRRDQAYQFSEALIESAANIRLKDINLAYQISSKGISYLGISQLKIFTSARNLGILWKKTKLDIDPDTKALYPEQLQIAIGLNLQF